MKTSRLFGMTMIAILMGASLASCTKEGDETPQYNLVKNEKKVINLEYEDFFNKSVYHMTYDNEGRLHESTCYLGSEENILNRTYIWKNSEITGNGYGWPYKLNNGLIRKYGYSTQVTYDKDQHLSKTESTDRCTYYYSLLCGSNDGRLTRSGMYYKKDENSARLELLLNLYYTEENVTTCNGFNPVAAIFAGFYEEDICIAHPELVGVRTNILPNAFAETYYSFDDNGHSISDTVRGSFIYQFDNDGYIIECIMRYEEDGDKKFTITWE